MPVLSTRRRASLPALAGMAALQVTPALATGSGSSSASVVASLVSAGASLITAAAVCYMASNLTAAAKKEKRNERRAAALPPMPSFRADEAMSDGWSRQVSVAQPAIGTDVYEVIQEGGRKAVAFQGGAGAVINDTTDAVLAMKNVFERLCQSSNKLLSVDDVVKVHNLLGEPMDDDEQAKLMEFFHSKNKEESSISFEMFMSWWSALHDAATDPDSYYSQERYRQRFKVLSSRLKDPKIASITTVSVGEENSRRYRVYYESDGHRLSPWHDIPLKNEDGSYNFITEIPKWTRKKYEIATGEGMNPIKQDTKNGVLREYKWGDMLFNYGAFPQTWEDPKHVSEETGCPGDNDPVDVIELGTRQRPVGAITRVKILGVIAMIDDNETDWKVLALACDDDKAANVNDLNDLDAHMPGVTSALTHWLRMYKTADGKKENRFGCGGHPQGAAFATKVVEECHIHWRELMSASQKTGKMKKVASGNDLFTELALED